MRFFSHESGKNQYASSFKLDSSNIFLVEQVVTKVNY